MKQILETQKEQMKEALNKEFEKYFEELTKGLENKTVKIDDIERMMGETKSKVSEIIEETTNNAVTGTESETEKNDVPYAGKS